MTIERNFSNDMNVVLQQLNSLLKEFVKSKWWNE